MTTTDTIEARVARGAEWLDENEPGWERRIDLGTLALETCKQCVLGQILGDYNHVAERVDGVQGRHDGTLERWGSLHGFEATFNERRSGARYEPLTAAWVSLIKERFASGLLSDERTAHANGDER